MKLYERFADKGYHSSIATTFGIDFGAYENIVLPRIRGAGCRNNMVIADGRMLTHALGGTALPRQAGRLYTATGARTERLFHPKLFLQVGRKGGRLIIGSANLTAAGLAGNLELVTMIECGTEDSGAQRLIAQAWHYLSGMIELGAPMLSAQQEWMLGRAAWLRHAVSATEPVTLEDSTQAGLLFADRQSGIGERFAALIDEPVKRLIVISPYWDEELAALSALQAALAPQETALLIDPRTKLFPPVAMEALSGTTLYARNGFADGRFIHAKTLIAETASADHLLSGSANCTRAALGTTAMAGHNEEAGFYRRLPVDSAVRTLGLATLLDDSKRIAPEDLPPLHCDDELAFDALSQSHPGIFSLHGSTMVWRPTAHIEEPESYTIELLGSTGDALEINAEAIETATNGKLRYRIDIGEELPAFARPLGRRNFSPAIITVIDVLEAAIRENHSRNVENTLAQLEGETEANLTLLEVLDVLEKIENEHSESAGDGVSVPKAGRQADETSGPQHRTLSYEEFIAGRRSHHADPVLHNSLGSSDVSIVRGFLNRIVGLNTLTVVPDEEDDHSAIKAAFDLADETNNAEAAMASGEEFDANPPPITQTEPDEEERQRRTKQRKATRDQLVTAAANFSKRIDLKQESDSLSPRDFLRLRALLMVLCAASWNGTDNGKHSQKGRMALQVLPVEGDPSTSWPYVIGRLLFKIFGGTSPAIWQLKIDRDHDQIPADLIECWATCFWCLQACLAAPLSPVERAKIDRYVLPLTRQAYRSTQLSQDELRAPSVTEVMDGMSAHYAERLGVDPEAITRAHNALTAELLTKRT